MEELVERFQRLSDHVSRLGANIERLAENMGRLSQLSGRMTATMMAMVGLPRAFNSDISHFLAGGFVGSKKLGVGAGASNQLISTTRQRQALGIAPASRGLGVSMPAIAGTSNASEVDKVADAWRVVSGRWPKVASMVKRIDVGNLGEGTAATMSGTSHMELDKNAINQRASSEIIAAISHELLHAAQAKSGRGVKSALDYAIRHDEIEGPAYRRDARTLGEYSGHKVPPSAVNKAIQNSKTALWTEHGDTIAAEAREAWREALQGLGRHQSAGSRLGRMTAGFAPAQRNHKFFSGAGAAQGGYPGYTAAEIHQSELGQMIQQSKANHPLAAGANRRRGISAFSHFKDAFGSGAEGEVKDFAFRWKKFRKGLGVIGRSVDEHHAGVRHTGQRMAQGAAGFTAPFLAGTSVAAASLSAASPDAFHTLIGSTHLLAGAFGEGLIPASLYLSQKIQALGDWYHELNDSTKVLVSNAGLVGLSLLGLVVIAPKIVAAWELLILTSKALNFAFVNSSKALAFSIHPVTVGMAALALALGAMASTKSNIDNWASKTVADHSRIRSGGFTRDELVESGITKELSKARTPEERKKILEGIVQTESAKQKELSENYSKMLGPFSGAADLFARIMPGGQTGLTNPNSQLRFMKEMGENFGLLDEKKGDRESLSRSDRRKSIAEHLLTTKDLGEIVETKAAKRREAEEGLAVAMRANRATPSYSSIDEHYRKVQLSALGDDPLEQKQRLRHEETMQKWVEAIAALDRLNDETLPRITPTTN